MGLPVLASDDYSVDAMRHAEYRQFSQAMYCSWKDTEGVWEPLKILQSIRKNKLDCIIKFRYFFKWIEHDRTILRKLFGAHMCMMCHGQKLDLFFLY